MTAFTLKFLSASLITTELFLFISMYDDGNTFASLPADVGVNTQWRTEWSMSCLHACSLKWAVLLCISTIWTDGGWMSIGCATNTAEMTELHYITDGVARTHLVSCLSKCDVINLCTSLNYCSLVQLSSYTA